MNLVSFSVQNYRSITKTHKLKIKDSTILIGPNNEGKSNILKALVVVLSLISRLGASGIPGGRIRRLPDGVEKRIKAEIADVIAANPADALNPHKRSAFDALVTALENKLSYLRMKND